MKASIVILLIFISILVKGQQTTHYTQFVYNYFAFNPALAGGSNCVEGKLGIRSQWVGIQGKPEIGFASMHARIKQRRTHNENYYHGVGGYVESDRIGYFSKLTLNGAYAYHMRVGMDIEASIGIFAGLQQFKIDGNDIVVNNFNDPLISGSNSAFLVPYFTPGVFLNHDDWFAGYSVRQIVRNKWQRVVGDISRNQWHHHIVGGKRVKLGTINVVPSAMIGWVRTTNPSINLNVNFELSPSIEAGLLWRNQDAVAALVQLKFAKYFTVGYSFDFTTSSLRTTSSNTHELIIGISSCRHDQNSTYICPVF